MIQFLVMKHLINRLICLFTRKDNTKENKKSKVYKKLQSNNSNPRSFKLWEHDSWGDKISIRKIYDNGSFQIVGWLYDRPIQGDWLIYEVQSGKYAKGIIHNIKYCQDPRDMFFADVLPVEYVDLRIY